MSFFLKEDLEEQEEENQIPGLKDGYIEIKQKVSSDFVWVRVKNSKFFFLKDGQGSTFGIECQCTIDSATSAVNGNNGFESFSLLQRFERGGKELWRTLIATTISVAKKYIGEFKQKGNQFVGRQSVYGISGSKCADLYLSFLEHNFSNIGKFSSSLSSLNIPDSANEDFGYASSGLVNLMKYNTERFKIYTERVPEVMVYMEDLILSVLGEDFFISQKNISEIYKENPEHFFQGIPKFLEFKKDELLEFLKTINIFDSLRDKNIRPYVIKSLPYLIDFFDSNGFLELLNSISVKELFSNGSNLFLELTRLMSAKGSDTKKTLFNFIDSKFLEIIHELGGKGIGLGKLINMLKRPKLDVHKEAKLNRETGNFEIERDERGEKVKKIINDENLILSSKEIKNLLDKHKDEIQDFFNAPDKNSYIEYLRFLIQHLPEGQSKGQLNAIKQDFVDYYNKKFDNGISEYPGKMLYYGLMNQLRFKLGEKTRRKAFDFEGGAENKERYSRFNRDNFSAPSGIWRNKSLSQYPFKTNIRIPDASIQDLTDSKYIMYLLKYFYKNLKTELGKLEYSEEGKPKFINTDAPEVKQALSDFLYITAALSGISKEEISNWMNKINANFVKMGEAERNPNKYKIPSPSPKMVDWANSESLYEDKKEKLDEAALRSYIKNKMLE